MMAPLLPSLAHEFGVFPLDMKWMGSDFSMIYGILVLVSRPISEFGLR